MASGFEAALRAIDDVDGWLSADQARSLFEYASAVPAGAAIVEIGSYRGRSTIVLGLAAPDDVQVFAIDPHAGNDRGPWQWESPPSEGEADRQAFDANLAAAGLERQVRHLRMRSSDAVGQVDRPVAMLYVDGSHRFSAARDDLVRWGERVSPGGAMLVHDSFSSLGVTLAILRELLYSGEWAYEGRVRSLARYRRLPARASTRQRAASALRQLASLPWFVRNLVLKLRRDGDCPY